MVKSRNNIFIIVLCALLAFCLTISVAGSLNSQTIFAETTHSHEDWNSVTELPTTAGNYVLTSDITLSETWTVPAGADDEHIAVTNLCLNGHIIKFAGENGSVINVPEFATLNLYDCDTTTVHNGYVDTNGLWHLDANNEHSLTTGETTQAITGGIITGGNTTTNGGGVNVIGTFNMYGGNIAGNTAQNGGGISNTKSFTMTGGNIIGNTATQCGGGVYASSVIFVNILTGGTITDNTAQNGGGVYYKVEECFAPGTLITMADGTTQKIETLKIGDSVRVFDHEKGGISSSEIFDVWTYPEKHSGQVKLLFSNDINITVVYGHSFFEREQNKYVAVTKDNVSAFIGHEFYNVDKASWETLEGYEFIDGEVDTYVITTKYQLNCVANGMLSNEDGFYTLLTNIFEYGDNLEIDQVKKTQDIAKFGLYDYENIKHMSKYVYDVLNVQYLKVAFGKGLITESEFNYLESYYAEVDPELYCDEKEETPVESKSILLMAPLKAPLLTSSVAAPEPGFYVGGSIKILGNNSGNLYISSGKTITIGTGTVGDGNGVVAPTEDMNIGITLQSGTGDFATDVPTADYLDCFTIDDSQANIKLKATAVGDSPTTYTYSLIHEHEEDGIDFQMWTQNELLPSAAGNWFLNCDVTLSSTWTVPAGIDADNIAVTNLCLNGHVINANGGNFSVITIGAYSTLNLYDCGTTVHNGYVDSDGLWHLDATNEHSGLDDEKDITGGIITGGKILGDYANTNGGGVYIGEDGAFSINGGTIIGNTANNGGGVYNNGTFVMTGGEISYNYAYSAGGVNNKKSFNMDGGSINNNFASYSGGVYNDNAGTIVMVGGEIKNNKATHNGGVGHFGTALSLGGSAVIIDNMQKSVAQNLYLSKSALSGPYRTITFETGENAPITTGENKMNVGITLAVGTGDFATGVSTANYLGCFTIDYSQANIKLKATAVGDSPIAYTYSLVHEHEEDGIDFQMWDVESSLPTAAGNWFLDCDVTLSSTWTVPNGITNLCLNGHVINVNSGNFSVITIGADSTLNLYDCGTTVHNGYVDSDGLWHLDATNEHSGLDDEKDITGGIITGGKILGDYANTNGGGVYIGEDGAFSINGGTIIGNTANNGGGVYNNGTFAMTAGEISYNCAYSAGGVDNKKSFNMTGGSINNNISSLTGGVYNADTFVMVGGEIINNKAASNGNGGVGHFGNVLSLGGSAVIANNIQDSETNNLYLSKASDFVSYRTISFATGKAPITTGENKMNVGITLAGDAGDFAINVSTDDYLSCFSMDYPQVDMKLKATAVGESPTTYTYSIVHTHEEDGVDFNKWTKTDSLPTVAGNYYLISDVTLSSTWTVPEGITNLCLKGYVINANGGAFSVITIGADSTLNLYDCGTTEHNGYVDSTGLWHLGTGEGTAKTITGGIIIGGKVTTNGGGVNVTGTFNMYGGNIAGNVTSKQGAGICVTDGTFNLFGGSINYNVASSSGGGVQASGGTFTMTGGSIDHNTAQNYGGGIFISSAAIFGGSAIITDNTSGAAGSKVTSNIYIPKGKTITLCTGDDAPTTMSVGVTFFDQSKKINIPGAFTTTGTADYSANFFSDNENYSVCFNAGTETDGDEYLELKQIVEFDEKYEWNNGESISYGESYSETAPKVFYENTEVTDLDFIYTYYQLGDDGSWIELDSKPSDIGSYKVLISVAENDTYVGAKEYLFAIRGRLVDSTIDISLTYDGEDHANLEEIEAVIVIKDANENVITPLEKKYSVDGVDYTLGTEIDWSDIEAINAGDYTMYYQYTYATYNTVSGSFTLTITKAEQVITITDISKIYDTSPIYFSINDMYSPKCTTLGDGEVKVEYKLASEDDDKYTTTAPTNAGSYVVRVSVKEGTNYLAGTETKAFAINHQTISQVGFSKINQPIATKTAPTSSGGMLVNTKYFETLTWSPALVEGKFDYDTVYTATVVLEIKEALRANYKFAEEVTLKGAGTGWALSDKSTYTKLIYTKEFEKTKAEQVIEISDPSKAYDGLAVSLNGKYTKLGDGAVTIEYKLASEDDEKYTTTAPINVGSYVVRISVVEDDNYAAGSKTEEFTISKAEISRIGFNDVDQPVAKEEAPLAVSGIAIGARYAGVVSWSPALVEGKFDYNTKYTVTLTLEIVPSSIDSYKFKDGVILVKPKNAGWTLSKDSTESKLIYTKEFEKTAKTPQVIEIEDPSKIYDGTAVSLVDKYTKLGDGAVTIEYKLKDAEDSTYTTEAPINAGSYVVRVSVLEDTTYAAGSETLEFTISQKAITVTIDSKTSIYGDEIVELTATDDGIISGDKNVYSLSTTASKTSDVGTYNIVGETLCSNYLISFEGGENDYTISQREITIIWEKTKLPYNNQNQVPTPTIGNLANDDEVTFTIIGEQKEVGNSYVATITELLDENYKLPETNLTTDFEIIKADYDMSGITFSDKSVKITDSDADKKIEITGTLPIGFDGIGLTVSYENNDNKDRGKYLVTAIFSTTSPNYNVPDEMTAILTILWVRDSEKDKGSDEELVIVTSDTGIDPSLFLKVDVVQLDDNNNQYNKVTESVKKESSYNSNLDKIFGVYDVSLLNQDDIKVQPDGTIKVYMTIPEEIVNCGFRIYHVHNGVAKKVEYVIEDGYAVVETDELSEFVFVYEQTSLLAWIIVLSILLALGLIVMILLIVKTKKNKQGRK